MYPTTLTQLARANPFSAPLFTLQKHEEPKQTPSINGQNRRLAAAAVEGKDLCCSLLVAKANESLKRRFYTKISMVWNCISNNLCTEGTLIYMLMEGLPDHFSSLVYVQVSHYW